MNQFFKFLFASCLGTLLALIGLSVIGFFILAGVASTASKQEKVSIPANSVLHLHLAEQIPERTNNVAMDPFEFDDQTVLGLSDMVRTIEKAAEDDDIKGIYLSGVSLPTGKASASVLRAALQDFQESGKFVIAFAPYYTQNAYYLASVADSVLVNPLGAVDFRGLSATLAYYKGMLDKLDVKMRIFYAGKFKSATEPFRLDKMSDANRLQVREYLSAMYDQFVSDIAESRGMSEEEIRRIADDFEGRSAQSALEAGLVDRTCYEDEAFNAIKDMIGLDKDDKVKLIGAADYFNSRAKSLKLREKNKIAVLYAEGTIYDGNDGDPGQIYSDKYVKMLRKIRKDKKVKALVLRVNSPGGSVMASENILREIRLFQETERPVVVSMGDVAASGGYYIACEADSIFAEPNTVTGSIGVFGMIPILDNTMKEHLGITFDTVRTGRFSAFGTPFIDFNEEESALIQNRIDWIYNEFVEMVADGRGMTKEEVEEIAQGRVWPGNKALELGLVDGLGGLDRAMAAAADLADLESYRTTEYPKTKTGMEQFIEQFMDSDKRDDAIRERIYRKELGEMYPLVKTFRDFKSSQGVQARLPYEFIIR